ncbi:MAG: hypothetical protein WCQ16_00735 [Verrucomicrobiae bacterium]
MPFVRNLLRAGFLPPVLMVLLCACASGEKKPAPTGEAGRFAKLEVAGVKLGDGRAVLHKFPAAKPGPTSSPGREVYEMNKPNACISLLVLTFQDGRVRKMELRYFNGPTEHTLTTAGEWDGLRNYLVKRFGPPTRTGADVPQLNDLKGLNAAYARFNGEWIFPKVARRMHYIAMADARGGVGVITFADTSTPQAAAGSGPNPGF